MKRFLLFTFCSFLLMSCSGDDDTDKKLDDFLGTYEVTKYNGFTVDPSTDTGVEMDLEVIVDPDNEDNLLINTLSIPADENGAYGPDNLTSEMQVELYFEDNEIFFKMSPMLINGIALPCTFIGPKK